MMTSLLGTSTLPKCWIVTCVQSLTKLLAIVLKLQVNDPCSSMGGTD